jgi:hypothetical protein
MPGCELPDHQSVAEPIEIAANGFVGNPKGPRKFG